MAITDGLLAAVLPHQLHVYSLSTDGQRSQLLRIMELSHPVGFATLSFSAVSTLQDLDSRRKVEKLNFCLSGSHGIYLYSFPRGCLIGPHHEGPVPPNSLRYSCSLAGTHTAKSTDLIVPCCPTFDATGTILTWLEGPATGCGRHYSFRILLEAPRHDESSSDEREPPHFELEHPDMPALYAEGVYHYDAGLGIAVFGNMFGELALFNLSGVPTESLVDAFEPLTYPVVAQSMPTVGLFFLVVRVSDMSHFRSLPLRVLDSPSHIAGHTTQNTTASTR